MNEKDTVIIFHRTKENAEESLAYQKTFLENYNKNFTAPLKVIDYASGSWREGHELREQIGWDKTSRIITIMHSALSSEEYDEQFDMHMVLNFLQMIDKTDLYMMDSRGSLYKRLRSIKDLKDRRKRVQVK